MSHLLATVLFSLLLFTACKSSDNYTGVDPIDDPASDSIVSEVDSANFKIGIPFYNGDQGKEIWTEFNSEVRLYWTDEARSNFSRHFFEGNPYLECKAERGAGSFGVRMALFKTLFDDFPLPEAIAQRVTGLSFNALGYGGDILNVEIRDVNDDVIANQSFQLSPRKFRTYSLSFNNLLVKEVRFYTASTGAADSIKFGIDDVYLVTNDNEPFTPPGVDSEFLTWLKRSSYNFFEWNYISVSADKGTVLESYSDKEKVSLSGLGYAYAIYILAAEEGYISHDVAKKRIQAMLNWQMEQNWFDGSGGWHGFPHHYFQTNGSNFWPDVSTIDWAICAAGIRVVKQYYSSDPEITAMAGTLLNRPDWVAALAENDKIAMGFDGNTGEMNDYRWGLAFSEETELVYLEAVASGKLDTGIFNSVTREKKNGFYPSWFGAGFTYNWLQLWTGPLEPFKTNAIEAYKVDASTSINAFGRPVMGLTACSTIKEIQTNGFLNWGKYISNQGGNIHGAGLGQVIQISPAPYGAALALPFTYDQAMAALREYVAMGYYHQYLGLPDNVRLKNLPEGSYRAPNWDPYDINIGPIVLAIEQIQGNRVGTLYLSDNEISAALAQLIDSFPQN